METELLRVSDEIARAREELAGLVRRRDNLIVSLHGAGHNNREIASLAGVTRWWVIKLLKRLESVGARIDGQADG